MSLLFICIFLNIYYGRFLCEFHTIFCYLDQFPFHKRIRIRLKETDPYTLSSLFNVSDFLVFRYESFFIFCYSVIYGLFMYEISDLIRLKYHTLYFFSACRQEEVSIRRVELQPPRHPAPRGKPAEGKEEINRFFTFCIFRLYVFFGYIDYEWYTVC